MKPLYSYQSLASKSIRLLDISDISDNSIDCSVSEVTLKESLPSFIALSYTWDGQIPDHEITVRDTTCSEPSSLKVTKKIYEALPYLNLHFPRQLWWIDAVCINQEDNLETSAQLPLMKQIYTGTKGVVVWLGKCTPGLQTAFEEIPRILELLKNAQGIANTNGLLPTDLGLPIRASDVWKGFYELFTLPYFRRVWTMQEVLLPEHDLQFMCGEHVVDWTVLEEITTIFHKHALWALCMPEVENVTSWTVELDVKSYYYDLMTHIKQKRNKQAKTLNIFYILHKARGTHTSILHDKIFGLLGLFDDIIRDNIDIDYHKPAADVFVDFSRILYCAFPGSFHLLQWASTQLRQVDLPSWCPDWNHGDNISFLSPMYRTGWHEDWWDKDISYMRPSSTHWQRLEVTGLRIDRISRVTESSWSWFPDRNAGFYPRDTAEQNLYWCRECHLLTKEAYGRDDEVTRDICQRTIIGDQLDGIRCEPGDVSHEYELLWQSLRREQWPAEGRTFEAIDRWSTYFSSLNSTCRRRKFFSTHEGRVGVGPQKVQWEDIVIIIPTCPWPIILRPYREDENVYELIGAAYVHGVMWGEMVPEMLGTSNMEVFILE